VGPLAASNQRIRRLRRLSGRRSARRDDGAFLLEGPVVIAEAIAAGCALEAIYVEEGHDSHVVDVARAAGVEVHEVADGVLSGITDSVTPRPVMAVAPCRETSLAAVVADAQARGVPLVVLVEISDPGNLGTILRAADAAGCAGVICTTGTADVWSPKTVRSSAGAVLHVPVVVDLDPAEVFETLGAASVPLIGTVVDGQESIDQADLSGPIALVMGSEAHGLPPDLVERLDTAVTIPMDGHAESLNVAMAASVLVFEAFRQRRATGRDTGRPAAQSIGRPDRPTTQ
jgi:RNA methyltransferase, TrmH family